MFCWGCCTNAWVLWFYVGVLVRCSPAIEFWNHCGKKLTRRNNDCKVYQGTSGADADASDHVLGHANLKWRTEAKLVTELVVAEGKKLENLLCKCGCITDAARGRTIDEKRQEELLDFAVVMREDLPKSAWLCAPRVPRDFDVAAGSVLWTYLPALTHAEREHVFLKTFDDMEGSNLKGTRGVQIRGRKKRHAGDPPALRW